MEGEYRPAHKLTLTKAKGKYHASCICGWTQTGRSEDSADAVKKYQLHAGIFEKLGRR